MSSRQRRTFVAAVVTVGIAAGAAFGFAAPASAVPGSPSVFVAASDLAVHRVDTPGTAPVLGSTFEEQQLSAATSIGIDFAAPGGGGIHAYELSMSGGQLVLVGKYNGSFDYFLLNNNWNASSFAAVFGTPLATATNFSFSGLDVLPDRSKVFTVVSFLDGDGNRRSGLVELAAGTGNFVTPIVDMSAMLAKNMQDDLQVAIASVGTLMWVWYDLGRSNEMGMFPILDFAGATPTVSAISRNFRFVNLGEDTFPAPGEADIDPATMEGWLTVKTADGTVGLAEFDMTDPLGSPPAVGFAAFSAMPPTPLGPSLGVAVQPGADLPPTPGPTPGTGSTGTTSSSRATGLASTGSDAGPVLLAGLAAVTVIAVGALVTVSARSRRRRSS